MKFKHFSLILVGLFVAAACGQMSSENSSTDDMPAPNDSGGIELESELSMTEETESLPESNTDVPRIDAKRKLIWTADMRFQVKNVDKSTSHINELCQKHGAVISDMQMTTNPSNISNIITLRVPNEKFQKLVLDIKGESIFLDRANISSNDVTEEYVDIESRLASKKEVRDRYIEILRNNTGSIGDVLEAEEAIRKITEEIEAKEGRLRYLKDQVAYSTISIQIYQKVDYQESPTIYEKPYSEEMGDSFNTGWGAIKIIMLALIRIWPILLILTVLFVWKRKWIRELFRH